MDSSPVLYSKNKSGLKRSERIAFGLLGLLFFIVLAGTVCLMYRSWWGLGILIQPILMEAFLGTFSLLFKRSENDSKYA